MEPSGLRSERRGSSMGMRVGIPDAGQINALETLNIRGERSVTCKGKFDAHPSTGPLPADAPAACEKFRQQPDALERAAELDAQYGRNPDLATLPMYCVVAAFKDPYDTKDMRTTSNNDVNFAMDVPPFDSTLVAQLRAKGAIIYAKSVAHEFNGGPGDPGGPNKATTNWVAGGQQISGWSGQPCNPYDTERVVRGSSGGSGAAIGGNLAMIGICEQSGASCQGPASRNGTALILTTKGIIPDSGGIGNQWFNDRAGIHARTLVDAAQGARCDEGSRDAAIYDPRDPFTALPKALIPEQPYASFLVADAAVKAATKPLQGMRIAILREHMAKPTKNHEAISDQIDAEIKKVLRDQLGAELVETHHAEVSRRSFRAEPDVHLRRCAVRAAAAVHAGGVRAQGRGRQAVLRRAGLRRDFVRLSDEAQQPPGAADATRSTSRTSRTSRDVPCHDGHVQRHGVRSRPLSRRAR